MHRHTFFILCAFLLMGAPWSSCSSGQDTEVDGPSGSAIISSALTADPHDVAGFLYEIQCEGGFSISEYVPIEDEFLPPWLDPSAGPEHYFSDLLAVIPPGLCHVTATPMQNPNSPSEECAPAIGTFTVEPGQTTEIVLWSECEGDPTGAGDIVVGLNDPPAITSLDLYPSKFICTRENLEIKVGAEDPNGDPLTYHWQITEWPENPGPGNYNLIPDTVDIYHATFVANTPGYYEITVTITDSLGASTSLTFPVHVSDCDVCCYIEEKEIHVWFHTAEECEQNHGIVVEDEMCTEDVCCALPDGTFGILPGIECEANDGHEAESQKLCEEVCCRHPNLGFNVWMLLGTCDAAGGGVAAPADCEERVCCELKPGAFDFLTERECNSFGGVLADPERCGIGCCFIKELDIFVDMSIEQCIGQGFQSADPERCEN